MIHIPLIFNRIKNESLHLLFFIIIRRWPLSFLFQIGGLWPQPPKEISAISHNTIIKLKAIKTRFKNDYNPHSKWSHSFINEVLKFFTIERTISSKSTLNFCFKSKMKYKKNLLLLQWLSSLMSMIKLIDDNCTHSEWQRSRRRGGGKLFLLWKERKK